MRCPAWLMAAVVVGLTSTRVPAQSSAVKDPPAKLAPADTLDGAPFVTAKAWAIADGKTGKVLWSGGEATPRPIASTTKVMTALLALRLADADPTVLDEVIVVSETAAKTGGSSARIRTGDKVPVREMLYGLLLPSGNDAAAALAEHFGPRFRPDGGPVREPSAAFVAEMNRTAQRLGLTSTSYLDPHGLGANKSTPRDLAILAWHALQGERFRKYVSTRLREYEITNAAGEKRVVEWRNSNQLLGVSGYDGVKTGTTTPAGACLIASGRRGTDHLLVVVLGSTASDARYTDTRNLFRWAWRERGHMAPKSTKAGP